MLGTDRRAIVARIGPVSSRVRASGADAGFAARLVGRSMAGIIAENLHLPRSRSPCGGTPICQPREKRQTIALLPGSLSLPSAILLQERSMNNHVYKHIELTGSSTKNIEDAVSTAIAKASASVRNIQWFEVVETRGHVKNGKVAHWQVTIKVGFTLED
jgi:flavin-binding protein dodecin